MHRSNFDNQRTHLNCDWKRRNYDTKFKGRMGLQVKAKRKVKTIRRERVPMEKKLDLFRRDFSELEGDAKMGRMGADAP